ncbi:hypothetical protein L6654_14980 [Bradyrhizobium sp. WYCCWR 13023]|uniref:Uncharacterized protein n=1 Tax=Bradyrhizobium zhengyangense TaxID=2911009 RepID=A0A9X1R8R2_9BRAD|nr:MULTISPECIES: hypothetical protein [Bradyrhizobium]MCG2627936.1 hypothetical protein [Bradyrhizobium zhengyangense]MCG2642756.1 hypothetical protein [Bradyrhizobium zhengyangense]MCG2669636.1 hypothetical protein [Bradyrhizobium zhengyangense]MDA9525481.1 hypothetical protein [Bradyrhizobium sp. CCBAU 11434]
MRTERIALGVALAIGGIVAQSAAFAEEYRGTMEQQMACTPDVWRLCSDQIPDVSRITACLRQNTPQLSSGCRAVFESNNQMPPQQQVPRNRAAPPPTRYNNAPSPQVQPRPYDDDDD